MNYWVIGATHFGHDMLIKKGYRPKNFSTLILNNINQYGYNSDHIFIHLGDVCIGNDEFWHSTLLIGPSKKWLLKGNHDTKSNSWYLRHCWDFVADSFRLKIYGKDILFSHKPKPDGDYDVNIHAHLHTSEHKDWESQHIKHDKQILVSMEQLNYKPVNLKILLGV